MNDLADELREVYQHGLQNRTATVEVVLFGIRRSSEVADLCRSARSSQTKVVNEIIALSGIGRNFGPMVSLGCNLAPRVSLRRHGRGLP